VTFAVGDRVRVVSTRTPYKEYVGVTGVVLHATSITTQVIPDEHVKNSGYPPYYSFSKGSWRLELEAPAGPEPYEEWFK